jgi:hypothetical protein
MHAAGHDVTFAAREIAGPPALAEELCERGHAGTRSGWLDADTITIS